MSKLTLYEHNPNIEVVTGVCPHDCPDTCSWQVAVDRDSRRAVDIWGNADHPITGGRLCGKVDRYLERTYHPERLTTPLRRVGAKGSGQFEPVSWDEAMRTISARLKGIIAEYGAEAVLPYSYAGTMGFLQGEGMAARFFNRMGASRLARTICSEAGFEGYLYTIGATEGTATEDFAHARLILLWGTNTLTSNLHLWPFIQEARKRGARVIAIDPAQTRTARAADEWIPIRPGTDGALALAMMHVIIAENLHDADYVKKYTVGFDQLAGRVAAWTPERAAAITGIHAERIRDLAREYATTRPAAIRINYGLQRHYGGGMAVRTLTCLPALIGAWREQGGGIQLSTSGAFRHFDYSGLRRPDLLNGRTPRTINMNRLGDALSFDPARLAQAHYAPRPVDRKPAPADAGPPVKALIVYNCNPAAVAPDQSAVIDGLRREDLFTVVLEHFQTDTADYADLVLPATTQLEHWDMLRAYGHHFVSLNRPAIPPVGESLPNSEIFRRMAAAIGYNDRYFAEDDETILRDFVESQRHPVFATVTWDVLMAQGFARLNLPQPYLPFAQGNFPTPSGKCEFYSARMADDGYDPIPTYVAPKVDIGYWVLDGQTIPNPQYLIPNTQSLICISPPAHSFLNSSFANVERFQRREETPILQIHPEDAAARGIGAGDPVRVWNDLGEVRLTAQITAGIIPGTVLAPGIWWAKHSPDGRNINQITPQDETDMGASARFYDTRVFVAVAESESTTLEVALPLTAD
ncbi:MAG: molybdopterin oxidoreductase family protein [Caldilineaceae bacterium]|nr:molybdopterin oxidoreductase family protein [Caldilineaceae bacterium]